MTRDSVTDERMSETDGDPMEPIVALHDVRFRYAGGVFGLRVPDLRIDRRETVAVVGPSGSGKTTLLHLIAGIERPETGRVVTQGTDLTRLEEARRRAFRIRRIGLVFQEFELLEYLSVLDNILLPYRIGGALRLDCETRDRARSLAEDVGIADQLGRLPRRLSQGERQRVAVCRALVTRPPLLLADEPTGNLDPVNKERVLDSLFEGVARSGATLVAVTHDHDILERFDRTIDSHRFSETHTDGHLASASPPSPGLPA
jgi:putative ABC transport system ATP-binding protein